MIGPRPRVLLAPGSGLGVGGGHVMRCLALAKALAARGAHCAFSCGPLGGEIVDRYADGLFAVARRRPLVLAGSWSGEGGEAYDALIVDDYRVHAADETPLRKDFPVIMVIDDLANRRHDCDLLLDPGYGRSPRDYADLIPTSALGLFGPRHALLRHEFAKLRDQTLRRDRSGPTERLFVNFGLSDVGGVAARAYGALRGDLVNTRVDLVLSHDAASLPQLTAWSKTDANLTLHIDCTTVASLMATADAGIGAGGASTWERACLGLATIAVIVADNQRPMIERLAADGALLAVELAADDFEPRLRQAYHSLRRDGRLRADIASRASALCDGRGADRAAEALLRRLAD